MKIHYITQWGENSLHRKLTGSPAALIKMKYMVDVMEQTTDLQVVSFSSGGGQFHGIYLPKTAPLTEKSTIRYCATFGSGYKIIRYVERIINKIQLFFYLLFQVRKNDIAIIYHERYYLPIVNLLKRVKNRKIIYEVNELYSNAANYTEEIVELEKKGLRIADGYIFGSDVLCDICDLDSSKPNIVSYGTYFYSTVHMEKFDDGKIHLFFSGTLDPKKGGAYIAAKSIEYLPENYHLHLLGFGSKDDVKKIKLLIAEMARKSKATVSYDGVKLGEEYDRFIRKCHIGLSTQTPFGKYNDSSFQSKVITYLANGLTVVAVKTNPLLRSKVAPIINFYEGDSPEDLAATILKTQIVAPEKSTGIIAELDKDFRRDFPLLLNRI